MSQLRPGAPKVSHACKKHSLVDTERSFCATNLRRRHISRPRHDRRLCSPGASAASRSINLQGYFCLRLGNASNRSDGPCCSFFAVSPAETKPTRSVLQRGVHRALPRSRALPCRALPCRALPRCSRPPRGRLPKFSPVPSRARLYRQEGMPIHGGGAA